MENALEPVPLHVGITERPRTVTGEESAYRKRMYKLSRLTA